MLKKRCTKQDYQIALKRWHRKSFAGTQSQHPKIVVVSTSTVHGGKRPPARVTVTSQPSIFDLLTPAPLQSNDCKYNTVKSTAGLYLPTRTEIGFHIKQNVLICIHISFMIRMSERV